MVKLYLKSIVFLVAFALLAWTGRAKAMRSCESNEWGRALHTPTPGPAVGTVVNTIENNFNSLPATVLVNRDGSIGNDNLETYLAEVLGLLEESMTKQEDVRWAINVMDARLTNDYPRINTATLRSRAHEAKKTAEFLRSQIIAFQDEGLTLANNCRSIVEGLRSSGATSLNSDLGSFFVRLKDYQDGYLSFAPSVLRYKSVVATIFTEIERNTPRTAPPSSQGSFASNVVSFASFLTTFFRKTQSNSPSS